MQTSGQQQAPLAGAGATPTRGTAEPMSLRALVNRYMAAYTGRDRSRAPILAWWLEQLGPDRDFTSLDEDDVLDGLDALRERVARRYIGTDAGGAPVYRSKGSKLSPSTINRYHMAVMALFTWASKRRLAPRAWENPACKIERYPEGGGVVRFLSDAERARLLEACRGASWPRLYVLVLMAITTGARRGELLALTWGAVDLERGLARVLETKNGEPRVLPLTPAVVDELGRFKADRADIHVFPGKGPAGLFKARHFEHAWYAALRAAKIKRFRFHDLRHTAASYLAQSGASLLEIADFMGHHQLAMVKRYAHLTIDTKAKLVNRVLGDIK